MIKCNIGSQTVLLHGNDQVDAGIVLHEVLNGICGTALKLAKLIFHWHSPSVNQMGFPVNS